MTNISVSDPAEVPGYGPAARALHWIIAALLVAQFVVAWTMEMPEEGAAPTLSANLHASLGATILLITVARLLWRLAHPVALLADLPGWMRAASALTHAALYIALILIPLAGLTVILGEGIPVLLYGAIPLPMIGNAGALVEIAEEAHELSATLLLILVGLHVAAALYHHFVRHDRVLQRMLPRL